VIISASWSGGKRIRVSLTFDPGELAAHVKTPREAEAWLKTVFDFGHNPFPEVTEASTGGILKWDGQEWRRVTPNDKPNPAVKT
jgi:hypothetical protein